MTDDLAMARLALSAALADGDSGLAYRLVLELMDQGVPMVTIADEVLAPIQWQTGQRWASGDVTISEEHASTAAIETLIAMLGGAFDQPVDAPVVVVACAEGDTHTLPARMAGALLAYEGFRTVFLGTSVPADDLEGYLRAVDADALVLSCTRSANLLGARACVAAAHRAGVPVVVGGRSFGTDEHVWRALGADAHVARLSQLTELVSTWQPDPIGSERAATPLSAEVEALVAERASAAAHLRTSLTDSFDPQTPAGKLLAASAEELVDTLAAALYLDDVSLLRDHAAWISKLIEQRGGASVTPSLLLGALADAARRPAPAAAALAEAANAPTT